MKKSADTRQFAYIFTVVGAIMLFMGLRDMVKSNASSSWPSTQGKIVSSGVHTPRSINANKKHTPVVRYEYVVDGHTHTSTRVSFGDVTSNKASDAEAVVRRYPAGSAVTVHYVPEDPASSVLEAGSTGVNYLMPVVALGFFGVGVWCFRTLPKSA